MKTRMIQKIFGGSPTKDIYAQWYIGPGRAEDLLEYGLETLTAFVDPLYHDPVEISPVETIPIISHAPVSTPPLARTPAVPSMNFLDRARRLANEYPMVIPALQQAFIEDAEQYVSDYGIEYALRFLRSQFESIRQAGARKYYG